MSDLDQRDVIGFLSNPASYGVGDSVQRIDTHASIVFLAGDAAYKLKRAVAFGHLDFTTRARRRLACAAEASINRQFTPDLYRAARTIRRNPHGVLRFDGDGKALDWVVEMRRFDPQHQLDVLADHNQLPVPMRIQLATRLSELHDRAEIAADPREPPLGTSDLLAGIAQELAHAVPVLDPAAIARWHDRARTAVAPLERLLAARRDAGKVRRCHGDLHLANWCLLDGKPAPFDAIEFSRSLATTDILYDLAFPLMDLAQYGRIEAANAVFNRYFDLQNEVGGLAALPLFQSLRAAIRAHVLAAASQQQEQAASRNRLIGRARAYLTTALEFLRPYPPRLIAIGGFSGTGKSTLAHEIAPCLGLSPGARVLRSDVLRKRFHRVERYQRLPDSAYDEKLDREIYRRLCGEAETALRAGRTVVADAFSHALPIAPRCARSPRRWVFARESSIAAPAPRTPICACCKSSCAPDTAISTGAASTRRPTCRAAPGRRFARANCITRSEAA
ncbi:MAG: hypothetical protein JWM77_130 [Rhodospirillales bacterium]|nr:hypothetical protein [Rhodospirillales bacterium]